MFVVSPVHGSICCGSKERETTDGGKFSTLLRATRKAAPCTNGDQEETRDFSFNAKEEIRDFSSKKQEITAAKKVSAWSKQKFIVSDGNSKGGFGTAEEREIQGVT